MTIIKQQDLIQSVADALQFISYYHPKDYIQALGKAYDEEQSASAKDAIAQILFNSRLCADGHRPICQDTGIAVVFVEVGMEVQWDCQMSLEDMINEGVRRAYNHPDNILRASVLADPAGSRKNTKDNTPAVIHTKLVAGNRVKVKLAAKGGGSENKARFAALNPSANLVDWIINSVADMGAGWCPPGIMGIGIGGTPEKAMLLAKESLLEPVNIQELILKSEQGLVLSRPEELRLELYEKINELGIGAQGLGGLTTVVDVKVLDYPTHAASLPVAIIPNCAATRHTHFTLDGTGPAVLTPPKLEDWPDVTWAASPKARRVNLDTLTKEAIQSWKPGEQLLLNGKLLTGRDAAHKRIVDTLAKGEALPNGVDFTNRFIYYVGPVDAVKGESVGPAGPTTSTRMDKYTETMLAETGLIGMVGKAERGPIAIDAIKKHKAFYLIAVGGAAYLISKAIEKSTVIAYEELGMEAIYEFEIKDMPVTVGVDVQGESVHQTGPEKWSKMIQLKK
ncbi:MAG: fumarate hydratase [gamma proteobacterium symbiont of Bathyaustriella thionipta]|nr:fumarate hydratase [gamma proteobacterium symbiont of Bathyaustriella thionipta]MCU7948833.1 fumarate hydratase [gamma proteobacterium symbiont of Bathyaustriella thionipta]MCU7954356.1 fumarate hydratase [gamma proteobacterium symbiont of Bathyaustriella thionipta]MCU7955291.1 fumarate hydratase [gamma proteobacterium symbiont of Bathyaustriella thionipta]MCU7967120.1 fumarate hydratase [gamma proteobacterium symbiont of Bathyaustriella thionipta]